jgi:hypothetical protein
MPPATAASPACCSSFAFASIGSGGLQVHSQTMWMEY